MYLIRIVALTALLVAQGSIAPAKPANLVSAVPNLIGDVTVRWLGLPVYRATLYAQENRFDWNSRFALELTYVRGFDRDTLVWSTMQELERMEGRSGDHAAIRASLSGCFRTVESGDRFLAYAETPDRVSLWFNGTKTCQMSHASISQRFLGIWLSDQSRMASVSRKLRGQ
ncbi:hypothetical protein [Shimia biformata]|uniref:hypothetical protein n=1 Tax=Shimia biformata TaxID=1294299 RepID=UPI00195232E0|nr:hypothetical protein [Shimia biformata]